MRTSFRFLLAVAFLWAACATMRGRSSGPVGLCDHLAELQEKQFKAEGGVVDEFVEAQKREYHHLCLQIMSRSQAQNPELYDSFAQCTLDAQTLDAALPCAEAYDQATAPKKRSEVIEL